MTVERIHALRRAVEHWRAQLINVDGRNRLLNYRDLAAGTIDLTPSQNETLDASALDRLLSGATVRMSALFPGDDAQEDARRRLGTIRKRAQLLTEEKGIDTLFAGVGLASWATGGSGVTPNAPVYLIPLELVAEGAAQLDFKLAVSGEPQLNPVLGHLLRTDHDLDSGPVADMLGEAEPESWAAFGSLLTRVARTWSKLPELRIIPRIVVGVFNYATMPMVTDLETNAELFAENDLVAAIAGVDEARRALAERICDPDPARPDRDPPEAEFLVLDADASQHHAIDRVLGGESIVIQGPPGTGKSQTIANLIGSLIARGKKVLFVAEKRAAIEAVSSRLERVGLADLMMDLHGGVGSKREFARSVAASLGHAASIPERDHSDLHAKLTERRNHLLDHLESMHNPREPWGLSVIEVEQRLLGIPPEARTTIRLAPASCRSIDKGRFERLAAEIAEWVDLGGPELDVRYPEWASASIRSADEARRAFDLVRRLAHEDTPAATTALNSTLTQVGLAAPRSVEGWSQVLGLLKDVESILGEHDEGIYRLDLERVVSDLTPAAHSPIARAAAHAFSGRYRAAKATMAGVRRSRTKVSGPDALAAATRAASQLADWTNRRTDRAGPRLPSGLDGATGSVTRLTDDLAALAAFFTSDDWMSRDHSEMAASFHRLAGQQAVAARIPRIHQLEDAFSNLGVDQALGLVGTPVPPELAVAVVEDAWLNSVFDELTFADPRLANFDGAAHSRHVVEFADLDRRHLAVTPERIRRAAAEAAYASMNAHPDETAVVRREAAKKTRHMPIRRLVDAAPRVLTALKPCWTMSPLLVAEMLPPGRDLFDVVIFDEASQIPPAEAIGSLARAPQAVIAGDDKQLPPTTFFARVTDDGVVDDQDDGAALTSDIESILDVARAGPIRETMLRWHYRSRDGRLIAFSNAHVYGGALTAFPGVDVDSAVSHHLVPFRPISGSSTRSNPDEVELVVDMILDHARTNEASLGVITFGQYQASNIEEALRRRLADLADPDLDPFFSETARERFFIKNIERVQGDERDVIILSVGYHKAANGTLPYRFGPLLLEGGERRLNVAVTRARSRVHLVSSFSHHDMDPARSSAQGVELLRRYLDFAASGGEALGAAAERTPLNPFELDIATRLRRMGVPVTPQYGVSGYRIDFACGHPDQPGRMVLAIEADGASYHATPTARDRDRLRQQVLEGMGWRFHRIWSTDWFRDPVGQAKRAVDAWVDAVMAADRVMEPERRVEPVPVAQPALPRRGPRPAVRPGLKIDDYTHDQIVDLACWILSDSLLRTDDQLRQALMEEMGFQRGGSRIVPALDAAAAAARRRAG